MICRERADNLLIMLTKEPDRFSRPDLESSARWLAQEVSRLNLALEKIRWRDDKPTWSSAEYIGAILMIADHALEHSLASTPEAKDGEK